MLNILKITTMNEDTIIENAPMSNENKEPQSMKTKDGNSWVNVTLSGVTGILMGAGAVLGAQAYGKSKIEKPEQNPETGVEETDGNVPENTPEQPIDTNTPSNNEPYETDVHHVTIVHHVPDLLHVANVSDNMSFGDAFAAARAEVGPGGVFTWHGGVYNTYTVEEWNAMSPTARAEFASLVDVAVPVDEIAVLPTDAEPTIVYVENMHVHTDGNIINNPQDDPAIIVNNVHHDGSNQADSNEDVHVIDVIETEDGHSAYVIDVDDDYNPDVAIIDVDDSNDLSNPDIIIGSDGSMATLEELNGDDNMLEVNYEYNDDASDDFVSTLDNPDVADDMPDYMNDALIDV